MRHVLRTTLAVVIVLLAGSGPASAHAALVGTDPADGSVVASVPDVVTLDFNEAVGTADVALTTPGGTQVEVTDVVVEDRSVRADVAATAQLGIYTLAYRVVSADGHPVAGTVRFETTSGDVVRQVSADAPAESFVHRHRVHLAWAGVAALVAVALVAAPTVRRRMT